jgi:phytanoyl-CoA hydroxylase
VRDVGDPELDAAIRGWRDDGYAVLRGVASPGTVASLRERIEALIAGTEPDPGLFFQRDAPSGRYEDVGFGQGYEGPDVAYRKIERLERDPRFWAWVTNPVFERLARRVLPGAVTLYRSTLFQKAARTGSDLPWHQDAGLFWGLDRTPCLQVWTALDDAPEAAGCLEIVPGSHHLGLATPMGGLVPARLVDGVAGTALPAAAGDVVLLHNLVWHRSGRNTTDAPRRGFSVSFLDGDTRCTRTRRAPRAFVEVFPSLEG